MKIRIIKHNDSYLFFNELTNSTFGIAGFVKNSHSGTYYANNRFPKFDSFEECEKYYFDLSSPLYIVYSKTLNVYVSSDKTLYGDFRVVDDQKSARFFDSLLEAEEQKNFVNSEVRKEIYDIIEVNKEKFLKDAGLEL